MVLLGKVLDADLGPVIDGYWCGGGYDTTYGSLHMVPVMVLGSVRAAHRKDGWEGGGWGENEISRM